MNNIYFAKAFLNNILLKKTLFYISNYYYMYENILIINNIKYKYIIN